MSGCEQCGVPLHQTFKGRPRRYCSPTCRKAAWRDRSAAWAASDPLLAPLPTMDDLYDAVHAGGDFTSLEDLAPELETLGLVPGGTPPSPENSTVADVSATIRAAQAIAAELRRHGLAAEGLVAVKCAAVASALDKALAAEFGDVLQS